MASENKSNNGLYFIVGALLVAVLGMGYLMYSGQAADKPDLAIDVGEDGIKVDTD